MPFHHRLLEDAASGFFCLPAPLDQPFNSGIQMGPRMAFSSLSSPSKRAHVELESLRLPDSFDTPFIHISDTSFTAIAEVLDHPANDLILQRLFY